MVSKVFGCLCLDLSEEKVVYNSGTWKGGSDSMSALTGPDHSGFNSLPTKSVKKAKDAIYHP